MLQGGFTFGSDSQSTMQPHSNNPNGGFLFGSGKIHSFQAPFLSQHQHIPSYPLQTPVQDPRQASALVGPQMSSLGTLTMHSLSPDRMHMHSPDQGPDATESPSGGCWDQHRPSSSRQDPHHFGEMIDDLERNGSGIRAGGSLER